MKSKKTLILGVALTLSLVLNYMQAATYPVTPPTPTLVGTYMCGGTYLVFSREGDYCYYQPFEFMEEGTYQPDVDDFYALQQTSAGEDWKKVLLQEDGVYLLQSDGRIHAFTKTNDVPLYDNVSPSYLNR